MCRAMPFSARALLALWIKNILFDVDILAENKSKCGLSWSVLLPTTSTCHCSFPKHFFSYCFCILSEFVKVFEGKVWRVQAVICIIQPVHFQGLCIGKISGFPRVSGLQLQTRLPSAASAMFFLICWVAAPRWQLITSVEVKFVARQVEASVVIRATKPKFVAESRTRVYFSQHFASTCSIVFCCETSWLRRR